MSEKTLFAAIACCILSSCGTPATEPAGRDEKPVNRIVSGGAYTVDHFCHNQRAIYVYDGYRSGGIATVTDAPECKTEGANHE